MLAKAIELSTNRKLGPVAATFVSQKTCPEECPWYDGGKQGSPCYANNGYQGWMTAKLNAAGGDHREAARQEAALIDGLSSGRPLRLHVVGDCKDQTSAQIVSAAADAYRARHNQIVWTYTRAWDRVDRADWGNVSVLASCETPAQARRAISKGYAPAIVVDYFASPKAYRTEGIKIVPCPVETGKRRNCAECRLCWNDDILRRAGITIGFEAHSGGAKKLRQKLIQIRAGEETAMELASV